MAICRRCGKHTSMCNRDLATGLCVECGDEQAAKETESRVNREQQHRRQLEAERDKRATTPPQEPLKEPLDGLSLIWISVATAVVGGSLAAAAGPAIPGYIVLGIAGMLYLAGVIRWAVSGSHFLQLNRLQRQNAEIIELLKLIARNDPK